MNIVSKQKTLEVVGLSELNAENASQVRDDIRAKIKPEHELLRLDLSRVKFIDSSGLGVLIALQKTIFSQEGRLQLIDPTPTALQILELTRLHRIFEIITTT